MNDSFISSFRTSLRDIENLEYYHIALLHEVRQETATAVEKAITTNARIGESMLFDHLQEYFDTYHHSEILLKQRYGYYRESIKDHPELEHHLEKRMNMIQDYFHTLTDAITGLMNLARLYFPDRIQQVDFIKLLAKYGIDFLIYRNQEPIENGLEYYFKEPKIAEALIPILQKERANLKPKDYYILVTALWKCELIDIDKSSTKFLDSNLIKALNKTFCKFSPQSYYKLQKGDNFTKDQFQFTYKIQQETQFIKSLISNHLQITKS